MNPCSTPSSPFRLVALLSGGVRLAVSLFTISVVSLDFCIQIHLILGRVRPLSPRRFEGAMRMLFAISNRSFVDYRS